MNLGDYQRKMSEFLYEKKPSNQLSDELIQELVYQSPQDISDRLKTYRNNLFLTLKETLEKNFPKTCEFLSFYDQQNVIYDYIFLNPSTRHNLGAYGREFPHYLNGLNKPFYSSAFLSELASFEWSWSELIEKVSDEALELDELQRRFQVYRDELTLSLRGSSRILSFNYDILSGHKRPLTEQTGPSVGSNTQKLMLFKHNHHRYVYEIEPELWNMVEMIKNQKSISEMAETEELADFQYKITLMIERKWLSK